MTSSRLEAGGSFVVLESGGGEVWDKPRTTHPFPRHWAGKVGKEWEECGKSQALPMLPPGSGQERWERRGRGVG